MYNVLIYPTENTLCFKLVFQVVPFWCVLSLVKMHYQCFGPDFPYYVVAALSYSGSHTEYFNVELGTAEWDCHWSLYSSWHLLHSTQSHVNTGLSTAEQVASLVATQQCSYEWVYFLWAHSMFNQTTRIIMIHYEPCNNNWSHKHLTSFTTRAHSLSSVTDDTQVKCVIYWFGGGGDIKLMKICSFVNFSCFVGRQRIC